MSALRAALSRIAGLFRRRRLDAELDEELAFHLDEAAADFERQGLSPAEARRRARLRLGGVEQVREAHRERRGLPWLEIFARDARGALRRLRHEPGFAAVAILTMALGIGANTAIFSLLRGVLLRPLPYPEPERMVRLFETNPSNPKFPVSPLNLSDYRRESRAFAALGGYTRQDLELGGEGRPERLAALQVTPDYFTVLGAEAALGRALAEAETVGAARVVVISDGLWRRRFGADPAVVGRAVRCDGESWTVVGVMPAGFEHVGGSYRSTGQGATVDAWTPLPLDLPPHTRSWHYVNAVGRLAPGVSLADAESDLVRVAAELEKRFPDSNSGWRPDLVPLHGEVVGRGETLLVVLMAAVGAVLLIACANVASLLLARATARRREIAVRAALGAGRGRLLAQTLTESLLLAVAGAAVGLGAAALGVAALTGAMPADFPRLHAVRLDGAVLAFTAGLAFVTALAFGLVPALAGGADPRSALGEGGRSGGAGRGVLRLRGLLVVAEVALAFALLIAAGLLLRSFATLQRAAPGFAPEGALTFTIEAPQPRYPQRADRAELVRRLRERLGALPGVTVAGAVSYLPWSGWDENTSFGIVGDTGERERSPHARFGAATPGAFPALGVPLVAGRPFDASDTAESAAVVAVNESLARAYFADVSPLGRRLDLWGNEVEIVAVVGDVADRPGEPAARPAVYWPHAQQPFGRLQVVLRTAGDPRALLPAARKAVAEIDPELPLADVGTLEEVAAAAHADRRLLLALVALFAGLALALAAVGAYGVLAYSVQQRRRELGVRVALGADAAGIVRLVVGQGLRLTAAGLGIGLLLALLGGRLLRTLLHGVSPADPATFAGAAATALLVGALASYLPAFRASKADPLEALRVE